MIYKNKFLLSLFAAFSLLLINSVIADPSININTQQISSAPASYLFVVAAGKGNLDYNNDSKTYTLSLNIPDLNQVLMFADRPNRTIKYITGTELQNLWTNGTNNFKTDPPNAVLSSIAIPPTVVVLGQMKVDNNTITYTFSCDKNLTPANLSHITLTIDDISFHGGGDFPIN